MFIYFILSGDLKRHVVVANDPHEATVLLMKSYKGNSPGLHTKEVGKFTSSETEPFIMVSQY